MLGGRYSAELGIDVDAGDAEIKRWFLAATLFGARISARIAERAFRVLDEGGLTRIGRASAGHLWISSPSSTRAATPAMTSAPRPGCRTYPR